MAITKDEFKDIMKTIVALFPKEELKLSKDMMDIWYEALSDLNFEKTRKGTIKYAQTNQWMPTIADIRKYAPPSVFDGIDDKEFQEFMERFGDRYE